jgi:hypothetical protein
VSGYNSSKRSGKILGNTLRYGSGSDSGKASGNTLGYGSGKASGSNSGKESGIVFDKIWVCIQVKTRVRRLGKTKHARQVDFFASGSIRVEDLKESEPRRISR